MRARKYVSYHRALYKYRTINVTPISMCYDSEKKWLEWIGWLETVIMICDSTIYFLTGFLIQFIYG
jgi:hypothetical protein